MDAYKDLRIKEYVHWVVNIHENQGYLGRCVVACKREDALDLADATPAEREELFMLLFEIRKAAKDVFQPDWFNYAFLGNEWRHLHGHVIPRYASSREFAGTRFTDELWGKNWRTDKTFVTPPDLLKKVVTAYQAGLPD
jgi:diadenosine tetraphosphate (Ap4A) HIT family hydrolase